MIAAVLVGLIAIDLALVDIAARPAGFSRALGPLHIRLHDPTLLLFFLAALTGALAAATWRTRVRGWALAVLPAAAGLAGIVVTAHAERMFPLGDIAVVELYVRSALNGNLLVGPYSRFGWHHPGPAYFYMLAPVYAAAGRSTASLAAGAAVLSMGGVALLAWLSARTVGTRVAGLVLIATTALLWRAPGLAVSAWNPHIVVIPAMALLVAAAGVASGDVTLLPLTAGVASLIAQSDAALVPVVASLGITAGIGAILSSWRTNREQLLSSANIAAWVMFAFWLVPAAEELTHSPGNFTLLWRFFVGQHSADQPWSTAASAWGTMLSGLLRPAFELAGGGALGANGAGGAMTIAVLELCALAALTWWHWRRHHAFARLTLASLIASIAALWSATRIEAGIMDHEVFWIAGLGVVNLVCIAESVAGALLPTKPVDALAEGRPGAVVVGVTLAAAMAICVGQLERAHEDRLPVTTNNPVVERLGDGVREYLESRDEHKAFVRIGESDWGFTAGVLLDLDRLGIRFGVEPDWMPMFPQSFAANREEDAEVAFGNGDEHEQRMKIPGATPIASFPPLYIDGLPRERR